MKKTIMATMLLLASLLFSCNSVESIENPSVTKQNIVIDIEEDGAKQTLNTKDVLVENQAYTSQMFDKKIRLSGKDRDFQNVLYEDNVLRLPESNLNAITFRNYLSYSSDANISSDEAKNLIELLENLYWDSTENINAKYKLEPIGHNLGTVLFIELLNTSGTYVRLRIDAVSTGRILLSTYNEKMSTGSNSSETPEGNYDEREALIISAYAPEVIEIIKEITGYKQIDRASLDNTSEAIVHGEAPLLSSEKSADMSDEELKEFICEVQKARIVPGDEMRIYAHVDLINEQNEIIKISLGLPSSGSVAIEGDIYEFTNYDYVQYLDDWLLEKLSE